MVANWANQLVLATAQSTVLKKDIVKDALRDYLSVAMKVDLLDFWMVSMLAQLMVTLKVG